MNWEEILMTLNGYLKCAVCGKVTQVKIEVSYTSVEYPIYIPCKNCDTLFVGTYIQNDDNVMVKTDFINAEKCSYDSNNPPQYICIVTRDFISRKVHDITSPMDTITVPTWMKFWSMLGHHNLMEILIPKINDCEQNAKIAVYEWNCIMALWFNKKHEFLKNQIGYYIDEILLEKDGDYIRGIRHLTGILTSTLFMEEEDAYNKFQYNTSKQLADIAQNRDRLFKELIKKFGDLDLYYPIEHIITDRIVQFYEHISDMVPMFFLSSLESKEREALFDENSDFGIFTTSFERLKSLYIDLFEASVQSLIIPIGLYNIKQRGHYNNFYSKGKGIKSIEQFLKLDTAFKKIDYLENNNCFAEGLVNLLNNKLRNSIGHCSYEISNLHQQVIYNRGKSRISLMQVAYESYQMMLYLVKILHIVTLLHEAYYKFNEI